MFKAFANTRSLKRLDLGENSLTDHFLPDAMASLELLDLSYNPISSVIKWIESLTIFWKKKMLSQCFT